MNQPAEFIQVTPHIYKLSVCWWGFSVGVWLVYHENQWILIDTGPPGYGSKIVSAVERRTHEPPRVIILTHGHLDHIGGLAEAVKRWKPEVWNHRLETPYIAGSAQYREIQPSGWTYKMIARLMPSQPGGVDITHELEDADEHFGLQVIHIPGHAPGMIALLHSGDRALIASDAFRFKPLSAMPIFTYNRPLARSSMRKLAQLEFDHLLPSHGQPCLHNGRARALDAAGRPTVMHRTTAFRQ